MYLLSSMHSHTRCPLTSSGHHVRFEVRRLSGEMVPMGYYDDRIHENTDMGTIIEEVGKVMAYPIHGLVFQVGRHQFTHEKRIANRDRTLLRNLHAECVAGGGHHGDANLVINVTLVPPPEDLGALNTCICEYPGHGCCVTGRTDVFKELCGQLRRGGEEWHYGCTRCGNEAICRNGNCGHLCCELLQPDAEVEEDAREEEEEAEE